MKKVIVCGAGIGGLSSAILLASKGFEVEIYEKNDNAGGKMNQKFREGYRFDTGPSLISMPYVFEDFFKAIGRDMKDYFELTELEDSCRYFWNDGTVFTSYCEEKRLSEEITRVFGESEKNNFFRYLDYGKIFYELSKDNFLSSEFSIRNYLTLDGLKNFSKFISGRSINDLSNKFFQDERLRQLMNRYATYSGSTPYLMPQFFSIIPYVEFKFGAHYVKGGIYKIANALVKLCEEFKIKINYGHKLTDINGKVSTIKKLTFQTGDNKFMEVTDFDIMVSNFTNLRKMMYNDYYTNEDWSSSGFIMLAGMNKQFSELSHHNILFSDNYEREFLDIFEKKIPADDMTIYISISNKAEKSDAPDGCENWFILINAPFLSSSFIWDEKSKKEYCDMVLDRIDSFAFMEGDSIRNRIKFCEIISPVEFAEKYNSEYGSIYGLSSNTLYTLLKRPKNKSDKFDNLYFTGGNTHPGGGVPLCMLSGKIVSELIMNNLEK